MGNEFRRLRKEKGLKAIYVAAKIGIAPSTLSLIENGSRKPNVTTFLKLCQLYEVDPLSFIS